MQADPERHREARGQHQRQLAERRRAITEPDAILVVARTGRNPSGRGQLSLVVVPTDAAGLERTMIPVEVTAPESQFTLLFDVVRVPAENLIGVEGEGLKHQAKLETLLG